MVVGKPTPQSALDAEMTVTTTDVLLVPPGPLQLNVYVYIPGVLIGPATNPLLEVGSEPLHPSEPAPPAAMHAVALVVDHWSVTDWPGWICALLALLALKVTVGWEGGGAVDVTATDEGALVPPGPVQVNV